MNLLDLILVLILVFSVWQGILKGFMIGMVEVFLWVSGLLLAFICYPYISTFIQRYIATGIWVSPVSFILAIIVTRLTLSAIANYVLSKIPSIYHASRLNKVLGSVPGGFTGIVYLLLITSLLILFPVSPSLKSRAERSWVVSQLIPGLEKIHLAISPYIEELEKQSGPLLTLNKKNDKFIKLNFTVAHTKVREDLEAKMLILINRERAKVNLQPLRADQEIAVVARAHSADMFARGYFSHYTPENKSPFDRMRAAKVRFLTAGENLALAQTLTIAHEGLMNSPGHRANILHKSFGRVGIGILDGGIYGLMVTQNFRN
ncbi:CvpA family protein [Desertivirga arenae]|uniref:CvpA family protein n=1 Tax=Desertivirga arenae TaxID=2810309 RepID=UPI001A975DED|nr:CvpA family protein [Pedobacter sp. SYSU D00823]